MRFATSNPTIFEMVWNAFCEDEECSSLRNCFRRMRDSVREGIEATDWFDVVGQARLSFTINAKIVETTLSINDGAALTYVDGEPPWIELYYDEEPGAQIRQLLYDLGLNENQIINNSIIQF